MAGLADAPAERLRPGNSDPASFLSVSQFRELASPHLVGAVNHR
jgi:hypothetical protein